MRKQFFIYAPLLTALLCAVLLSCADETSVNKILGSGSEAPVFISYKAATGTEVMFKFSTPVKVIDVNLDSGEEFEPFPNEFDSTIALRFLSDLSGGKSITADLLVEDADGNSLNVLVPFKTRNDRLPKLVINELRFVYSSPTSEFIELYTLTDGNLGAMRLFMASVSIENPVYEFPPVEVKAGEYIVLHLRTLEADTAIDELDERLDMAKAGKTSDTKDNARDLWVPGSMKYLHTADVIYLVDQDDRIIDGLAIAETAAEWEKRKELSKAAEFLAQQGAWLNYEGAAVKTPEFADVVNPAGNTATRTLCRDEIKGDSNTAADWYICYQSNATPGEKNSEKRYVPSSKSISKKKR
jgi:hypothetical protein